VPIEQLQPPRPREQLKPVPEQVINIDPFEPSYLGHNVGIQPQPQSGPSAQPLSPRRGPGLQLHADAADMGEDGRVGVMATGSGGVGRKKDPMPYSVDSQSDLESDGDSHAHGEDSQMFPGSGLF
jgi:hypothetical protein